MAVLLTTMVAALAVLSAAAASPLRRLAPSEEVCKKTNKQQSLALQMGCLTAASYEDTTAEDYAQEWHLALPIVSKGDAAIVWVKPSPKPSRAPTPEPPYSRMYPKGRLVDAFFQSPDEFEAPESRGWDALRIELDDETWDEAECAISFVGSNDHQDLFNSYHIEPYEPVTDPQGNTYEVHAGFYEEAMSLMESPEWEVWDVMRNSSVCSMGIYFTGFSLGGALASLFHLQQYGPWSDKATLITFGAPPVVTHRSFPPEHTDQDESPPCHSNGVHFQYSSFWAGSDPVPRLFSSSLRHLERIVDLERGVTNRANYETAGGDMCARRLAAEGLPSSSASDDRRSLLLLQGIWNPWQHYLRNYVTMFAELQRVVPSPVTDSNESQETCSYDTRGTCFLLPCWGYGSNVSCQRGRCLCRDNFCFSGGQCRPAAPVAQEAAEKGRLSAEALLSVPAPVLPLVRDV